MGWLVQISTCSEQHPGVPGLSPHLQDGQDLCRCSPTLPWFLHCHASAIKKNCWMTVIERNNGLLQDVQTGSLQYIFLCNLVMNKIQIYQLILFVSTLLLIGVVRLWTVHFLEKVNLMKSSFFSNSSVESCFAIFMINVWIFKVWGNYHHWKRKDKRKFFTIKLQINLNILSKMISQNLVMGLLNWKT